jgi:glycosyltransferase involved in cell wall biosynthesis
MDTLHKEKNLYFEIKKKVDTFDNSIMDIQTIKNIELTENMISIVMTSSNRSKQTYYTLKTIQHSIYKNIHIIIVDDSTDDPLKKEILETYPFYIDFITINRQNKNWLNPVVNYNIGFKFIKGSYVIIQNAEVCHLGDVINFLVKTAIDNSYYVFDVKAVKNMDCNEEIYKIENPEISILNKEHLYLMWYQHKSFNRKLHFLTGMTIDTFKKINEFSYDYCLTIDYDDDDFILKVFSKKCNIINIFYEENNLGGIHLFHESAQKVWSKNTETNKLLFEKKLKRFQETGEYIDITKDYDKFDEEYKKLS